MNKKILFFLIVFLRAGFLVLFSFFSYAASKHTNTDKKDNLVHKKESAKKSGNLKKRKDKKQTTENKKESIKSKKGKVKEKTKKNQAFSTRIEAQKAFISFSKQLLKNIGRLREVAPSGRMEEVLMNLSRKQRGKIEFFLEANRPVLGALHSYNDLHKVDGIEIIPGNIYKFIKQNFAIEKLDQRLNIGYSIVHLVGGTYTLQGKKEPHVEEGLLDLLMREDISVWKPIKSFHTNFIRTLAADKKLAKKVGSTLPDFIQEYYKSMDVETRLELFQNILEIVNKDSSKINDITLAVKVFQSSGPLLIKMLQELQEEIKGTDTPISEILEGLVEKSPIYMEDKAVEKLIATRLKQLISGSSKMRQFELVRRLGVASIGQAHEVTVNGLKYALKVQKEGVDKLFYREKSFVSKMLDFNEKFDKGLKQWIENIWEGIEEELDFRNEKRFIQEGYELYTNLDEGIKGLSLPSFVPLVEKQESELAKNTLFMGFATGKEVGKIMKEADPSLLIPLYSAMQRLYLRYLKVALGETGGLNFYHGDLHRGNIYYQKSNDMLTMIDFGNAGVIEPYVKDALLNMYKLAENTNNPSETIQNNAIRGIGQILKNFILESLQKKSPVEQTVYNNHDKREVIALYFDNIFNESVSKAERLKVGKLITTKRERLLEEINKLNQKMEEGQISKEELSLLSIKKDNADLMKALSYNSFTGIQNSLVKALVTDDYVSNKLRAVFDELRRNGIAMPKEAIFFNKSNVLLQGILENIRLSLEGSRAEFEPVKPDDLFYKFLNSLGKNS